MTAFLIVLAVAAGAYLLGSVDTGILVSKYLYHDDVRNHGSGAAGMTNMLRTFGKKAAALTAFGDVLKGALAVCIGRWLFGYLPAGGAVSPYLGVYLAAILATIGHLKPLYFGFKGGKGVSSTCGVMLMTFWWQALICYVITIALIAITKFVSLGSLALVVLFGILVTATNWGNWLVIAWVWVIAGLCIYRHHANIGRLIHGTERKIGQKA